MPEVGSRTRNLPAPPAVVHEDLGNPNRQQSRPWLALNDDETFPEVMDVEVQADSITHALVWSSPWPRRPDARIEFALSPRSGGTDVHWTLTVDEPIPEQGLIGHMRKRINTWIFGELRYSYGQ